MKRKILRSLRIDEISAVDRPAQVGARFTLMKRADPSAPDETVNKEANAMDGKKTKPEGMTDDEWKAVQDMAKKADDAVAKADRLEKVVALKADQRAHFDTLTDADADAFLAKSEAERTGIVTKASEADAVVYTCKADGREIRKSEGETVLAMAKRMDEQAERLAKAEEREEHATLMKRAEADLPNIAGTVDVRAAMLKAFDGITDEATRKAAHEALKGADAAIKAATTTLGSNPGSPVAKSAADAKTQFEGKVTEIAKRDGVTEHVAYSKAADEYPDLVKSMNAA